ncbi:ferritin-like domain-containing protein [Gordonia defluvii]|jgi:rubrerythrin|uniref:Ferritin-like domain-containing protein n=1 Tax=Gordonia defluvii TaxID=283718 RepID=A0ABP6LI29_9ACTN|nr:ferritin-like domain-containing protein [Gordonia sp. UBA5067]
MTVVDALSAAVRAEDAAIFTYGVMTAFTRNDVRSHVAVDIAAHRVRRRALADALVKAGGQVPAPAPGYQLTVPITDVRSAGRAAVAAENDTAITHRVLVEQADTDALRQLGVDGLTESAVRAVYWRGVAAITPTAIAMPGDPRAK